MHPILLIRRKTKAQLGPTKSQLGPTKWGLVGNLRQSFSPFRVASSAALWTRYRPGTYAIAAPVPVLHPQPT